MIARAFLIAAALALTIGTSGQQSLRWLTAAEKHQQFPGAKKVLYSLERMTPAFVLLDEKHRVPSERGLTWLKNDILRVAVGEDFQAYRIYRDKIGWTHTRFRQMYHGLPVVYGVYILHEKDGYVYSANGEYYRGIQLNTTPSITPAQAYAAACSYINATVWAHDREEKNNNQLMVLPFEGKFYLVYRCDIYALEPLRRDWVYVDAHNGQVIKTDTRLCSKDVPGTAKTAYYGTVDITVDSIGPSSFRLREYSTRVPGIETWNANDGMDFTSTSKNFDYGASLDAYALDCHFGTEKTYDFYLSHGWQSLDGVGTVKMESKVHGGPGINAYWDGTYAIYLDGDPAQGVTPLTSMEVVGHELTHGVDDYSADLVYSGESGALDESFADITGVTVRFLYTNKGSWYLGDEFNYLIRNMANPNEFQCADTYGGDYWNNGDIVHFNSGVTNYWFYLLTEGGSGINDVGNPFYVEAIGLVDAAAIATRTHLVYLTPNAKFSDFYYYSVQSAQDLFGDCSVQAYQTANAGYAVNIGSVFEDAVTAGFSAQQLQFCSLPATVHFTNLSINGTTYLWDFGDGNTSTDVNPVHTYTNVGTYTVTLYVEGVAACNTHDTLVKVDYITVQNIGAPLPPSCVPMATQPGPKFGTKALVLGDINHTSGAATAGYEDFSCAAFTMLVAGNPYPFTLTVGSQPSDVRMWIDYNNDGIFDNTNELVFAADDVSGKVQGILYTPTAGVVLNTPLRLRIIDDKKANTITDACYIMERGQAEDYMVYFTAPAADAPVVDFKANPTTINMGQSVNFQDLSLNVPTSWNWQFPGAIPSSSTDQHPVHIVYPNPGTYDVTLTAANAYGSNTLTKTAYITVNPVLNLCGTLTFVDLPSGTVYDSGGPAGNYGSNEYCTLLIKPTCAKTITLTFSAFYTYSANDVLRIYDGENTNAPLLATISGYPWPYPVVTATSGAMFLEWSTDNGGNTTGFAASWTSVQGGTVAPITDFSISDANPAFGMPVSFTDLSTNLPIDWNWDFGDGNTSDLQNPTHTYASSGVYTVTLTASNCGGSSSMSKTVVVQQPPVMMVAPNVIDIKLGCGTETATASFSVTNNGGGNLIYQYEEVEYAFQGDKPHVLALAVEVDMVDSYNNLVSALATSYPNHTVTQTLATTSEQLALDLKGKNVFLMPKPTGNPNDFIAYADALNDFVNMGGTAILIAGSSGKASCLFNTGLLQGSFGTVANNTTLNIINVNHPITQGLGTSISAPKNTYAYDITSSDFVTLIEYNGNDVLGYRQQGLGRVVFVGFDFKNSDPLATQVMGNIMGWVNSFLVPDFVIASPATGGVLSPSQTQTYELTISSAALNDGLYSETFIIAGNDPNNPVAYVTLNIEVDNTDCNAVFADVQCGGTVCFDEVFPFAFSVVYHYGDGTSETVNDPCHTYTQSGTYTVTVIGCGSSGCDTIKQSIDVVIVSGEIEISGTPTAGSPIQFYSNAQNAESYFWDFGDGNTSTLADPVHTYQNAGVYTVTLTLTDSTGCSIQLTEIIDIAVSAEWTGGNGGLSLYPNPSAGWANLELPLSAGSNVRVELWNSLGQRLMLIHDAAVQASTHKLAITAEVAGIYYVRVQINDQTQWLKWVVSK
ncbi:MAG: PKD domain-containing protein [Chitinophagales bacterium]|nr:PKD domain-containing protein [Chitinophagales bacterium]MDW8427426.1 PKD domain-containing protein [Chitinophagales bacterium]